MNQSLINKAKEYKKENYENQVRTVITDSKLNSIIKLSLSIKSLEGNICEVGVWRGAVGVIFGEIFQNKNIYLFDTFDGIPFHDDQFDNIHRKGDFGKLDRDPLCYTSFEEVKDTLSIYKNIFIYQGIFPIDTAHVIEDKQFALVHIDVDIYQSYKDCLEFFYPKMVKGGLILLDDYNISSCKGATIAVDNFCKINNLNLETHNDQFFLRKN